MLQHTTAKERYELTSTHYTAKVWKPNHCAFGNYTDGCWMKVHYGSRDGVHGNRLQKALIHGASIVGLELEHFRYFFECTEDSGINLYLEGSKLRFYANGTWHDFTKQNRPAFLSLIKKNGWHRKPGSVAAKQKALARADALNSARVTSGKATAPNTVFVPLPSNSYHQQLIAHGLDMGKLTGFLKWEKEHQLFLSAVSMSERVQMFNKTLTFAPLGIIRAGVASESADAFVTWVKANQRELMGVNLADRVARFNGTEPVEEVSPLIIHAAHVLAYRANRKNRLRALRRQIVREGQGRFRLNVLANFDGCAITGLTADIEAAHIVPDCVDQDMRPENGIALVSWLHIAFDALAFTVNPVTLTVTVAPAYRKWLQIHGTVIADGSIWQIDRANLVHHYERFREANQ